MPSYLTLLFAFSLLLPSSVLLATPEKSDATPYVQITVNGLEEVAPPLDRLAQAVESLADSEKLSDADQAKLMAIMDELKGLSQNLDNSIHTTREKISEAQTEIANSLKRLIWAALASLVLAIAAIAAIVFYLIKRQVGPLVDNTGMAIDKVANTVEHLSQTAEFISAHQSGADRRRFARRRKLIN